MYLGIEIGGTKLQMALGNGEGTLVSRWRGIVDVTRGGDGIRETILAAIPGLLETAKIDRKALVAVGIGFGGPIDDITQRVIKSHQIAGWNDYPLAEWLGNALNLPAVLGNDADVAGLAEALFGAGKNSDPVFYITVGSGIGGGFVSQGKIYRAVGRGAAEIGHLRMIDRSTLPSIRYRPLEQFASGWSIQNHAREVSKHTNQPSLIRSLIPSLEELTVQHLATAAERGDQLAHSILTDRLTYLAEGICQMIALLCPAKLVIGGGVSLIGEKLFLEPLRQLVNERVFEPFRGLTEIVAAKLGEEVVLHGALALAREKYA
jgi:glucokinase